MFCILLGLVVWYVWNENVVVVGEIVVVFELGCEVVIEEELMWDVWEFVGGLGNRELWGRLGGSGL